MPFYTCHRCLSHQSTAHRAHQARPTCSELSRRTPPGEKGCAGTTPNVRCLANIASAPPHVLPFGVSVIRLGVALSPNQKTARRPHRAETLPEVTASSESVGPQRFDGSGSVRRQVYKYVQARPSAAMHFCSYGAGRLLFVASLFHVAEDFL